MAEKGGKDQIVNVLWIMRSPEERGHGGDKEMRKRQKREGEIKL